MTTSELQGIPKRLGPRGGNPATARHPAPAHRPILRLLPRSVDPLGHTRPHARGAGQRDRVHAPLHRPSRPASELRSLRAGRCPGGSPARAGACVSHGPLRRSRAGGIHPRRGRSGLAARRPGTPRGRLCRSFLSEDWEAAALALEQFLNAPDPDPLLPAPASDASPTATLAPREREVLTPVAAGRRNREIAEALNIAPATVTRHVSNLLAKTGLSNRTELATYAATHGLSGN